MKVRSRHIITVYEDGSIKTKPFRYNPNRDSITGRFVKKEVTKKEEPMLPGIEEVECEKI